MPSRHFVANGPGIVAAGKVNHVTYDLRQHDVLWQCVAVNYAQLRCSTEMRWSMGRVFHRALLKHPHNEDDYTQIEAR